MGGGVFRSLDEALRAPAEARELRLTQPGTIPGTIAELTELRTLYLGFVSARDLPAALWSLPKLEVLDLELDGGEVPAEIGQLHTLKSLDITMHGEPIPELPDILGGLASLKKLRLFHVLFPRLPPGIFALPNLAELSVLGGPGCAFPLPPEIAALSALQQLDLWQCGIDRVPDEIVKLSQLRFLMITFAPITALPSELGRLEQLQSLDVGGCKLRALPPLAGLRRLRVLDVHGNPIGALPADLASLDQMHLLYASACGLAELPKGVLELPHLEMIDLTENTFTAEAFRELEEKRTLVPGREIRYPKRSAPPPRPRPPATRATATRLASAVRRELERLGVEVAPAATTDPTELDVGGARHQIPKPIAELFYRYRYPARLRAPTIGGDLDDMELAPDDVALAEYACVHHGAYVHWASSSTSAHIVIDLGDPSPADPMVHFLEVDGYGDLAPIPLRRLSEWLAAAEVTPPRAAAGP
jgi:Leucine-rich repeat (LRR) protein